MDRARAWCKTHLALQRPAEDGLCYGMAQAAGAGKVAFFSFALENVGYENRIADIVEATVGELSKD